MAHAKSATGLNISYHRTSHLRIITSHLHSIVWGRGGGKAKKFFEKFAERSSYFSSDCDQISFNAIKSAKIFPNICPNYLIYFFVAIPNFSLSLIILKTFFSSLNRERSLSIMNRYERREKALHYA